MQQFITLTQLWWKCTTPKSITLKNKQTTPKKQADGLFHLSLEINFVCLVFAIFLCMYAHRFAQILKPMEKPYSDEWLLDHSTEIKIHNRSLNIVPVPISLL